MNQAERDYLNELATKTIGAAYEVANVLGPGFLERVYERSLVRELKLQGILAKRQAPIVVNYKGERVGVYRADVLVDYKLIIEVKCADSLVDVHLAQCLNYLKATNNHLCLLINFQKPRVEWKRIVRDF
ncbi:MAG: GxxExxY protein [Planctomycetaceae bacterium]|nr:GxxExxY protein [Planctomycetaceae bacterium]